MGARRTGDQWQAIVAAFERSTQSVEQFCAKRDIRPGTFKWWRWRLRTAGDVAATAITSRKNGEIRLLPVSIVGSSARSARESSVEITFADVSVRVEPGTDAAYVATLVAELRSRC
jgi:hypothetical protein